MTLTMNSISEAVNSFAAKYPCIQRIGIFGSYARGDHDETSDVDLLYDYDRSGGYESTHEFLSFAEDFIDWVKPLDADFVCYTNVLKRDGEFKQNVINDVIWVYEIME
jgi:predicted nucleotidyltransferase